MADALDVLTLEEAKTALNLKLDTYTHDAEVAMWVTAVSRRLDDICGPIVTRTVTEEIHSGGGSALWLYKTPVASITTLTEYSSTTGTVLTAETNTTKPDAGYLLDPEAGRVYRRAGGGASTFTAGDRNIVVTYVAGRFAGTASVDPKFKAAAGAVLRRLWSREQGAWARGADPFLETGAGTVGFFKAVDPMVREFLADEVLPPVVA